MHIVYAASRGWLPDTLQWWKTVSCVAVPVIGAEQKKDFECGYIAAFFLWQYLHLRGNTAESTNDEVSRKTNWVNLPGNSMHAWLVECLFRETVTTDDRYPKPSIPTVLDAAYLVLVVHHDQGCHNGRLWMKITVRTSARVRIYPVDATRVCTDAP
jgi:hypothetical protein